MTLGCLFHSGRSAENSQPPHAFSKLFLCLSMTATLPHQDFVPLSDVNTSALALGWTGRPFASILPKQAIVTLCYVAKYTCHGFELLCRNKRFCGLPALAQWAFGIIFHSPPDQICN
ncbi:hypothetical protein PoB_007339800 [Plakobranchus ocellatus]|uniref:Uncharacterized protein n=1 Tax=Plakobranchus ocellatus TaxID=259542 RepID=A0AAV4DRH1_9GAST|nr:hypothetical protein PoB_007339800 [Plakobranchus ocellatus]